MKKVIISIAFLATSVSLHANNFSMPGFNNGNGFNNGSSWSMPNMNWGNGNNGFNNGSNWSMPTMNWGTGNNTGNNWSMPSMNWGNSNFGNNLGSNYGYNNGSNWNMPNMNWGNSFNNNNANGFNNGSNWSMPTMNWGNANNNYAPNIQYRAPNMPVAPQYIPQQATAVPAQIQAPVIKKPVAKATTMPSVKMTKESVANRIPMPSEVKGTILAPANKTIKVETTK